MVTTRSGATFNLRSRAISNATPLRGGKAASAMVVVNTESYSKRRIEYAVKAIDYYNERASQSGGMTYELVEVVLCKGFMRRWSGWVFHMNFTAIPKCSDRELQSQPMLFFAELKSNYPDPVTAHYCTVLGPAGHVSTGYNGCRDCGYQTRLHHPPMDDLILATRIDMVNIDQ